MMHGSKYFPPATLHEAIPVVNIGLFAIRRLNLTSVSTPPPPPPPHTPSFAGTSMGSMLEGQSNMEDYDQDYLLEVFSDTSSLAGLSNLHPMFVDYGQMGHMQYASGSVASSSSSQLARSTEAGFGDLQEGLGSRDLSKHKAAQAKTQRKLKKPTGWANFATSGTQEEELEGDGESSVKTQFTGSSGGSSGGTQFSGGSDGTSGGSSGDDGGSGYLQTAAAAAITGATAAHFKKVRQPLKRKKGQDEESVLFVDDQSIVSEDPTHHRTSAVAAKERRRERNKVLARKTRVKKKVELETLRDQVCLLQAENGRLKAIVKNRLPTSVGAHLLCECDIQLPDNVAMAVQTMVDKAEINHGHLFETLKSAQRSFCISNAQGTCDALVLPCRGFFFFTHFFSFLSTARDQPIVYASPGFVELTGYSVAEILGRNCRFLQGPATDMDEVTKLRKGIESGEEVHTTLLNYKKDGSTFWNHIQIAPMVDHNGRTALVIGVQCQVRRETYLIFFTHSQFTQPY